MDHFGIGQALAGCAEIYFRAARQSGRSTSLLESLKDGDRVVFSEPKEARRISNMCRERGLKVDCIVVDVGDPGLVYSRGTPKGRTIFDHNWVEQFYLLSIARCARDIDHLQRESSGFGEAHRETMIQAEARHRWPGGF